MSLNWMINSLTNYRETGTWENLRVSSFVEIFKLVGTSLNDIFDADSIISKVRELQGQSTEYWVLSEELLPPRWFFMAQERL